MSSPARHLSRDELRSSAVPPFYMYGDAPSEAALDFSWLRGCRDFDKMLVTAERGQLAEVFLYDLLRTHERRTRNADAAILFILPVWMHVSYRVGHCNRSTNEGRMSAAVKALKASPHYQSRYGRPAGFDHVVATTHFGQPRGGDVLGPLKRLMKHFIVGNDLALDVHGFEGWVGTAVGRCSIELPYVASQYALAARQPPQRHRPYLVSFRGSTDVCCAGKAMGPIIRTAVATLSGVTGSLIVAVSRLTDNEWRNVTPRMHTTLASQFRAQADELASSEFCLVPAGDYSVTSRLYNALAAGCIPVVIAPGLAGAFASHVPYDELWLRVSAASFLAKPLELIQRLEAMPHSERVQRRHRLLRFASDVLYDVPGSRVADNFLRTARLCLDGATTERLGAFPAWHRMLNHSTSPYQGLPCSCVTRPPSYWWAQSPRDTGALEDDAVHAATCYGACGPAELCRCNNCHRYCDYDPWRHGRWESRKAITAPT